MTLKLSIQYADDIRADDVCLTPSRTRRLIRAALPARCTGLSATLRYVGKAESKSLNRQFRGKPKPTNVLTFNYAMPPDVAADLAICLPIALEEALAQGKPADHHLAHLIVHGVLHACGLDHLEDREAQAMERLEAAILRRFRIPDPYDGPLSRPNVAR